MPLIQKSSNRQNQISGKPDLGEKSPQNQTHHHGENEAELSLTDQVRTFWDKDWKAPSIAKNLPVGGTGPTGTAAKLRTDALQKLMKAIGAHVPLSPTGLKTGKDREDCLNAIRSYIDHENNDVLGFIELVQDQRFDELHLRLRSFSKITSEDVILSQTALFIRNPLEVALLLLWLGRNPQVLSLAMPTSDQVQIFKALILCFTGFFHQSSEQVAVMKVAGYNLLLRYANQNLCAKYYPELPLFGLSSEESPAEVVAWTKEQKYKYLLTGRADGFIVTLMSKEGKTRERKALVGSDYEDILSGIYKSDEAPKYETLLKNLGSIVEEGNDELSYEIVLLEAKRLQLPYKSIEKLIDSRLTLHLKQIISECAAIKEYGPEKCQILKFILSDGDCWVFGLLQNPDSATSERGAQRECFFTILNNAGHREVESVVRLLATWMVVPGDVLLKLFQSFSDGEDSM